MEGVGLPGRAVAAAGERRQIFNILEEAKRQNTTETNSLLTWPVSIPKTKGLIRLPNFVKSRTGTFPNIDSADPIPISGILVSLSCLPGADVGGSCLCRKEILGDVRADRTQQGVTLGSYLPQPCEIRDHRGVPSEGCRSRGARGRGQGASDREAVLLGVGRVFTRSYSRFKRAKAVARLDGVQHPVVGIKGNNRDADCRNSQLGSVGALGEARGAE